MKDDSDFLMRPERRHFRRLDIALDVALVIEGKQVKTTTTNISCGGIFVPTHPSTGQDSPPLKVSLNLPSHLQPLNLKAGICRVEPPLHQEEPGGVALQFKGLFDDNILALDAFIKAQPH